MQYNVMYNRIPSRRLPVNNFSYLVRRPAHAMWSSLLCPKRIDSFCIKTLRITYLIDVICQSLRFTATLLYELERQSGPTHEIKRTPYDDAPQFTIKQDR
jgi:hypothetical protein